VHQGSLINSPSGLTPFGLTGRIVNGTKAILGQFPHQVIFSGNFNLIEEILRTPFLGVFNAQME